MAYEIGLSLSESKIVWTNGPYKAKTNDIAIFQDRLLHKLGQGLRVFADSGYKGYGHVLAYPNSNDLPQLRKFKQRAAARQETINTRLKTFKCMSTRFCHGPERHQLFFDAVIVILQLQMDNGSPLFQI